MADILLNNTFTSYNLTPEEILRGSIFNELQRQCLCNQLADYAEQKLALEFDPEHPLLFTQNEASIAGKIDLLRYQLDSSEASLEVLESQTTISE